MKMNTDVFMRSINYTCFMKILLDGCTVGFFSYNEEEDKIDKISIQMLEVAQRKGIGSFFLKHITELSKMGRKPIFLKVFKTNSAQNLYKQFGFQIYNETFSHYLMSNSEFIDTLSV